MGFFRNPDGSMEDDQSMQALNDEWRAGRLQRYVLSGGRLS